MFFLLSTVAGATALLVGYVAGDLALGGCFVECT